MGIQATQTNDVRPWRALFLGTVLSVTVALWGPYNCLVLTGSYTTIDFTTGAAVFLLFFVALFVNSVQISPRAAENLHDGAVRVLHRYV